MSQGTGSISGQLDYSDGDASQLDVGLGMRERTRESLVVRTNDLVRDGYNLAAERYLSARGHFKNQAQLALLTELLPRGARVLDVGCGAGVPIDAQLVAQGYQVTGIDLSPVQISLARSYVPGASYAVQDLLALRDGEYQVEAIVSFYTIFHTPRETHLQTFQRFFSFLPPGGLILVTMGTSGGEGIEHDFFGVTMFWSQFRPARNRELFEGAGFTVLHEEIDESGGERHQVILAQRPQSSVLKPRATHGRLHLRVEVRCADVG